jgi:hypothetical protein
VYRRQSVCARAAKVRESSFSRPMNTPNTFSRAVQGRQIGRWAGRCGPGEWVVLAKVAAAAMCDNRSGQGWQAAVAAAAGSKQLATSAAAAGAPTHVEAAAAEHEQGLAGCPCSLVEGLEADAPLHQQAEAQAGLCAVQDGLPSWHRPPAAKPQHLHGSHKGGLAAAEQGARKVSCKVGRSGGAAATLTWLRNASNSIG